jgi:outer membrane protein assembly factor BamD
MFKPFKLHYISLLIFQTLILCGCAKKEEYIERPVEVIYNEAYTNFKKGSYAAAAPAFEEVERQHPYSLWAIKSQLMAAFSYYADDKYDEAVNILDKFIALRPGDKDIAYAHYLKSICFYERISDVGRDQIMTELALKSFEELIKRFPDSHYAKDANVKRNLVFDHLAGKEMEIGRFYLNKGQYTAALGRFTRVMNQYQKTTHIEEALGIQTEAKKIAAILGHNYPASIWYRNAYDLIRSGNINPKYEPASWWSRPWKKLL